MCSVCNCFAWTLDLFQRALTFCLSCWLAFAICCGLGIAIIAGIAYGYNYCMAEFITLTRSDIRVYMRRGQFYDKPDLIQGKRRMGDDEDVFPFNLTEDYQQEIQSSDAAALSNKWMKYQDTRKYAEKLTKYLEGRKTPIDVNDIAEQPKEFNYKFTIHPAYHSVIPDPMISTTIWQSDSTEIIMRIFEPVSQIVETDVDVDDNSDAKVNRALDMALAKTTNAESEDAFSVRVPSNLRIQFEDRPRSEVVSMRYWRTTSEPVNLEYSADVEDNIIYKSV